MPSLWQLAAPRLQEGAPLLEVLLGLPALWQLAAPPLQEGAPLLEMLLGLPALWQLVAPLLQVGAPLLEVLLLTDLERLIAPRQVPVQVRFLQDLELQQVSGPLDW